MKHYEFCIWLAGNGENEQEAWNDAVEAFQMDPGSPSDTYTVEDIDPDS